jgi:hypothetical protein
MMLLAMVLLINGHETTARSQPAEEGAPPWRLTSVRGRPIDVLLFGAGERTVLLIGGVHGDEPAGVALTRALVRHLRTLPPECFTMRIVVMPLANPDGLAAHRRGNTHGIDLNHNFPTRNFGTVPHHGRYNGGYISASEPETRAMLQVVDAYQPALIISCHAPLACVNYDGPAQEIARRIAALNGLPVVAQLSGPFPNSPGSLGTYYGKERGLPVITLELVPGQAQWARHGAALLDAMGVLNDN